MIKGFLTFFICLSLSASGQTHFVKSKEIKYTKVKITHGTNLKDSTYFSNISINKISSLQDFRIEVREVKRTESSKIIIFRNQKLYQKFTVPFSAWLISDTAFIADINGDKRFDIKFFIYNNASGLAGSLCKKVYLFKTQNKFKLVSFFDFAYEEEYDLNNDGNYEIISCNHEVKGNHSYWVYNAYNLKNGIFINNSKKFNYPLWTKFLEKTNREVANFPIKERMKGFKSKPDELLIN